jgi:hypothetical protein
LAPCHLLLPLLGMFLPDIHIIQSLASFKTMLRPLSQWLASYLSKMWSPLSWHFLSYCSALFSS